MKEEIEVDVTVKLIGEPTGVKKQGGSLDHGLWELDVICLPTNIPEHIEVDVSHLNIGDGIHVKDLVLPQGVRTDHDPEAMVASVVAPMREEEEDETEAGAAEPEVIGEKERQERKDSKEAEKSE